ncbi:MAG: DUF4129 domain-containing protein [bacterium]
MIAERRGFGAVLAALPLTAVVIEFCWLYPWLLFLTGLLYGFTPSPLLPAWAAFLLLFGGSLVVRRAAGMTWSLAAIRAGVLGLGLLSGLIAVKTTYYPGYAAGDFRWLGVLFGAAHDALPEVLPPVAGAVTAALLWWRGVVLGGREFSYVEIDRLFRSGIGWSVLFVILFAIYHDSRAFALAAYAPVYLLAFFSLSLLALAVSRLVDLWSQTHADEQQALAMNRHWLMLLAGVVGLILLAAVVVSGAMPGDLRPTVSRVLSPLLPLFEVAFYVIFAIALIIARVIIFILSAVRLRTRPLPGEPDPLGGLLTQLQQIQVDPGIVDMSRWGMVFLAVGLLCLLIAVAVVRARRRQRKLEGDERESVWSTRAALAGLTAALRSWWASRGARAEIEDTSEVGAIRAIYRELLRWAADRGAPRRRFQTPYEFLPQLEGLAPERTAEVTALTAVYVKARYTPDVPTTDEIADARAALDRVRTE